MTTFKWIQLSCPGTKYDETFESLVIKPISDHKHLLSGIDVKLDGQRTPDLDEQILPKRFKRSSKNGKEHMFTIYF